MNIDQIYRLPAERRHTEPHSSLNGIDMAFFIPAFISTFKICAVGVE